MISVHDHSFIICAYKESSFLEDCILSLLDQTVKATILMTTSTPNSHITELCEKYSIPLFINESEPGIAADWNFALQVANTSLITLAHQDDIYCPCYLEDAVRLINASPDPLLYFTNYGELRGEVEVDNNTLLKVKRMLLNPLKNKRAQHSKFIRRRILSMGSVICCPAVTLVKHRITPDFFKTDYSSNLDWQAWAELAKEQGDFIYNPAIMMRHRIHEESETSKLIQDNKRGQEDLKMLQSFWPKPIASLVYKFYTKGQMSNDNS